MPNLRQIIQQIQKELFCPVCGKHYEIPKLSIKGFYDKTLIIQTECSNHHTTIFMTSLKNMKEEKAIAADDLLALHECLKNFDGNFAKLWKQ